MFKCEHCDKTYSRKDSLTRHMNSVYKDKGKHNCSHCNKSFTRRYILLKHCRISHQMSSQKRTISESVNVNAEKKRKLDTKFCDVCKISIELSKYHAHERSNAHKNKVQYNYSDNIEIINTALKNRIVSYRIKNISQKFITLEEFLESIQKDVIQLLEQQQVKHIAIKVNFELFGLYSVTRENVEIQDIKSFNTKNIIIGESTNLNNIYTNISNEINVKSEEFSERGSGWVLINILHLEVNINKYNPVGGSTFIDLPSWVKNKKAVINIKNNDDACFAWSIVAALHPSSNCTDRISSYPHYSKILNTKSFDMPMKLKDIDHFEEVTNISVNVYGIEDKMIVGPLHLTKQKKETHVNLLYINDGDKNHYCYIKNLGKLINSQLSKHGHKTWLCDGCLVPFKTEKHLNDHSKSDCSRIRTFVPQQEKSIIKFCDYNKQMQVPFVIYADFEAVLTPYKTCRPNPEHSFTTTTHKHEPHSFAYFIKCSYDNTLNKFQTYRGLDCVKVFMQRLEDDARYIHKVLNTIIPMLQMTDIQLNEYELTTKCSICGFDLDETKVVDHDHLTGYYRGAAHRDCNLNYKIPKFIPIILHNLSHYDSHFIIKEFDVKDEKIDLLANNKERYISFTKYIKICDRDYIHLRFIDSFRFMSSSLEKLANNLKPNQFNETFRAFPNNVKFNLLKQKGVFPYEYVDCIDKLDDTSLPHKSAFYSTLTNSNISDDAYSRAQNIWSEFQIKTLGEYSDLYLKIDVLLLTDIFEQFRSVCIQTYSLDPCHFYTAPGLSFQAMLKYTKVNLQLLTDIDMIKFIQKGIRGGLCQCSGRFAQANNKYMSNYNPDQPSKYIVYLDANNLYGWAMSQYMPLGDFRWLNDEEIKNINIETTSEKQEKGYILEVDLTYSENLHDLHNDLPFCPENIKPPCATSNTPKLIANLFDKHRYIIHYRNLKQCIKNGLILKTIHRVLEFTQKPWLKTYIDLNNNLRIKSCNEFEKDFFKLMNNSVFGKTMENVDKRVDIKLITHWENCGQRPGARSYISKPNFHSSAIIHENLVVIQMNRLKIVYDKPIYVGCSILEIARTLIYDFHYSFMVKKYGSNVKLLYTDTDSLVYLIFTNDFYDDIKGDLNMFDTSGYSENNIYRLPLVNKKVLGKMKDECNGTIIDKFVGVKSKSYCIVPVDDKHVIKKIKGVKKNVVKNYITVEDYENCVNNPDSVVMKEMSTFRSVKHEIFTQLINKLALSYNDDKRYIIPNSSDTLAWGNKQI